MTSSEDFQANFDLPATVVDLLLRHSIVQPDRLGFTFLVDGETTELSLTYGDLDRRARAIGAWLNASSPTPGCALLLLPQGLGFLAAFFGCLYAGMAAVPMHSLDMSNMHIALSRISRIAQDCRPTVAFTTSESLCAIEIAISEYPELKVMRWVATEAIPQEYAEQWVRPKINGNSLALLQYTSGSTSDPKGVVINHSNLLWPLRKGIVFQNERTRLTWMPLEHSLALNSGVIRPLYSGSRSILMSPEAFLQDPLRWLRAVSRYKVSVSGGPCFAYNLCVSRIRSEACRNLDLSTWRIATVSAERANLTMLDRFAVTFAPYGFRSTAFSPTYGLTEMQPGPVSQSPIGRGIKVLRIDKAALQRNEVVVNPPEGVLVNSLVSSGKPIAVELAIVNPNTQTAAPPNTIGEIWISSDNIAEGYWNKPAETDHTFKALLSDTQKGPFLRTGDLGFVHDGEVIVTGRLKDLIIIRGRNIYPQDIEFTLENCRNIPEMGCCAAFSVENATDEHLIIIQEVEDDQKVKLDSVIETIRKSIFEEHGVFPHAVVLVKRGNISKTRSGKLRRDSCRAAYTAGKLEVIASSITDHDIRNSMQHCTLLPRTPTERKLAEIWCAILNLTEIGIYDNFVDLGGHSILATQCLNRIRDGFGVELPISMLFADSGNIRELAEAIENTCATFQNHKTGSHNI